MRIEIDKQELLAMLTHFFPNLGLSNSAEVEFDYNRHASALSVAFDLSLPPVAHPPKLHAVLGD